MLTRVKLFALAAFLFVLTAPAGDAIAGDGFVKKVDEHLNRWKALDYHYKIVTTKKGSDNKNVLKLRMRMKYTGKHNKQLIEIAAPADMKGTRVLTLSATEMYIYLPAYKKIRRIASHVTEQGFLGTALSQKDMTLTRYGPSYKATTKSDSGGSVVLDMVQKDDSAPYPRLRMTVDKEKWVPTLIEYLNADGKLLKTEKRTQYRCGQGYCAPGAMKVVDHAAGVTSILYLKKMELNPKLKKSLFSKRSLK